MTKTLLCVLALLWVWCPDSHAYVHSTKSNGVPLKQPDSHATLNPQVGCSAGSCFTAAARAAAQQWNRTGARFTFRFHAASNAVIACQASQIDGVVTITWSQTVCGEAWGEETLALTHRWSRSDGTIADADIHFNANRRWDVYTGRLRPGLYDFQRLALHELGHVLGLAHPDDHGQTVRAIMNSRVANLETLQPDDIEGIIAIYGREQTTPTGVLENPGSNTVKSGISFVSGWVCEATHVEVEIKGARITAFYGQDRSDTRAVCGDANNGFIAQVNWNSFGAGTHQVRLLADGRELVSRTIEVVTYGAEFLRGQREQWTLEDWPMLGTDTVIGWTESLQNIEIVDIRRFRTDSGTELRKLLGTWRFSIIRNGQTETSDWAFSGETTYQGHVSSYPVVDGEISQAEQNMYMWTALARDALPDYETAYTYVAFWRNSSACHRTLFRLTSPTTIQGVSYSGQRDSNGVCRPWSGSPSTISAVRIRATGN